MVVQKNNSTTTSVIKKKVCDENRGRPKHSGGCQILGRTKEQSQDPEVKILTSSNDDASLYFFSHGSTGLLRWYSLPAALSSESIPSMDMSHGLSAVAGIWQTDTEEKRIPAQKNETRKKAQPSLIYPCYFLLEIFNS